MNKTFNSTPRLPVTREPPAYSRAGRGAGAARGAVLKTGGGGCRYLGGMETRVERVVLETDRHRIVGDLTLAREGYRSRLSDFLNRGDLDFIPLVNAEIHSLNGSGHDERSFIAVARTHVLLAYPHGEQEANR
jgi:hypothetical protein